MNTETNEFPNLMEDMEALRASGSYVFPSVQRPLNRYQPASNQ